MTDVLMAETASGGEEVHEPPDPLGPAGAAPVRRLLQVLEPSSLVPTYVGIAVVAIGFALIGIAWAKVAALTNVALQLPYVVSAGISGLAVVMCGVLIVNVAAKRQDAAERARQMERLTGIMGELKQALGTGTGRAEGG
jgi:hypothetical protein